MRAIDSAPQEKLTLNERIRLLDIPWHKRPEYVERVDQEREAYYSKLAKAGEQDRSCGRTRPQSPLISPVASSDGNARVG